MANTRFLLFWWLGLANGETQTTDAERDVLKSYVKGRRNVVEIGVFHGVNTKMFRDVMANDGRLFAIDPFFCNRFGFSPPQIIAKATLRQSKGEVVWIRELGREAAKIFRTYSNELVDFIFVDGDHSWDGVSGDWYAWRDVVALDGIVAFHDSEVVDGMPPTDSTGSVIFTRQIVSNDPDFKLVETVDSTKLFRRIRN